MYIVPMYSKELVKGTLRAVLLRLLRDEGRMYGYEMTQRVRAISGDRYKLTEGSLYPTLHKMVEEGLLATEEVEVGGRIRKYYGLTEAGHAAATDQVQQLREFLLTMERILNLKPDS